MDSSHVALVSLSLQAEGFKDYRSDKPLTLGGVGDDGGRHKHGEPGEGDEIGGKR